MACHVSCQRGDFTLSARLTLGPDIDWLGVVGASGAGKTSLLRCLAGLESAAQVEGFASWAHPAGDNIVLVSAQTPLFPALSVEENLQVVARYNGVTDESFQSVVDDCECRHLLAKAVTALSGGETQRVALARGLLANPSVLLMDESTSAMDTKLRARVLHKLKRRTQGLCKVIWVSHDWQDIARYSDEVAVLKQGKVTIQDMPANALSQAEASEPVSALQGCLLQGPIVEHEDEFTVFAVGENKVVTRAVEPGEKNASLLVDARQVLVSRTPLAPAQIGYVNRLPVKVKSLDTDSETGVQRLTLNCGNQTLFALLEAPAARHLAIQSGEAVYAYFGAGSLPEPARA